MLERTVQGQTVVLERATTFYFDEVGQRLSSVVTPSDPATGGASNWTTYVERDNQGRVVRVGTPASIASYSHALGSFQASSDCLLHIFSRQSTASGHPVELDGFIWRVGRALSWNGPTTWDAAFEFEPIGGLIRPSKMLPGYTVRRPLVHAVTKYPVGGQGDPGNETVFTYHLPSSAPAESSQALTIDWMTTDAPAVSAAQHGSGQPTFAAAAFRPDGRVSYVRSIGDGNGTLTYFSYNVPGVAGSDGSGLLKSVTVDVDSANLPSPSEFPLEFPAGSANPAPRTTQFVYDSLGRVIETVEPTGLRSHTAYQRLADGRAAVVRGVQVEGPAAAFASPGSIAILNLAGAIEATGLVTFGEAPAFGEVTTTSAPPSHWLDVASSDPLRCLLQGTVRSPTTTLYGDTGVRPYEHRRYFAIPVSGNGTPNSHYDQTTLTYDALGRPKAGTDPTGTISRASYDVLDRTVSTELGVSLSAMRLLTTVEYDGGASGGNSLPTTITEHGGTLGGADRVTTTLFDLFGRPRVVVNSAPPHAVILYDNLGRVTAAGTYGDDGSSLLGLDPNQADPTAETSDRLLLIAMLWAEWHTAADRREVERTGLEPATPSLQS